LEQKVVATRAERSITCLDVAISLRKYAEHRGVSHTAVQRAIQSGRLRESLEIVNGRPQIRDVETADREWHANTRPTLANMATTTPPRATAQPTDDGVCTVPDINESRARREAALAGLAELDLEERRGKLVPVDEARATVIDRFTAVRTRLLGLPSRCRQQLPNLTDVDVRMIDDLVREALEELAADDATGAA
jgi:hypothetical protein